MNYAGVGNPEQARRMIAEWRRDVNQTNTCPDPIFSGKPG
jgi:hypothetical protein